MTSYRVVTRDDKGKLHTRIFTLAEVVSLITRIMPTAGMDVEDFEMIRAFQQAVESEKTDGIPTLSK